MDKKHLGRWKPKSWKGKTANWLSGSVSVSLSAMLFTTPLCAYYFGMFSIVGIVTNILTLWVVTVIFYGVMFVCAVGLFFPVAASLLAWLAAWPIRYVIGTARLLGGLPFSAVFMNNPWTVGWLILSYFLLGVFLLKKRKQVLAFGLLELVALLVALSVSWIVPSLDSYRFTIMNVGQGQCILLQSEGRYFLVDCGGDHDETAADIAAETMLSQGITHLDGVFLTHYDADHSAGLPYLLSQVDADNLYLPDTVYQEEWYSSLLDRTSGSVARIREDTMLAFGNSKITLFAPDSYNSGNESSMCILFETENCDILITGDRGKKGEEMLVKRHALPDVEILVAGHHGAADAVSELLLQTVKPEYVAISVGKDNSYGHPAQDALERLERFGCQIYRTDRDGTITFKG